MAERVSFEATRRSGGLEIASGLAATVLAFFLFQYVADLYDTTLVGTRLALWGTSLGMSLLALWLIVRRDQEEGPSPGASIVWTAFCWNGLHVAQLAYVGFLLIPLEVLVAAAVLRYRAQLSWKRAGSATTIARATSLGAVLGVRALLFG